MGGSMRLLRELAAAEGARVRARAVRLVVYAFLISLTCLMVFASLVGLLLAVYLYLAEPLEAWQAGLVAALIGFAAAGLIFVAARLTVRARVRPRGPRETPEVSGEAASLQALASQLLERSNVRTGEVVVAALAAGVVAGLVSGRRRARGREDRQG